MNLTIRSICIWLLAAVANADPLIVAHRGASYDAPENTLPAFELSWKQGADAIEGDFHLTKDGKIICIHDYDTMRVAGTKLIIKESTLEQLRMLDAGQWFRREFKGTQLPTFAEVAATVPSGRKFYVEIKCGSEIIPILLNDIKNSGLGRDQIIVISFHASVIREMKKQAPSFKAYWLYSFDKASQIKNINNSILTTLRDIRADGFSSRADDRIDSDYIKTIRQAGFEYHCWTVDDPSIGKHFMKLGVQSITTNRPAFMRAALSR